MSDLLANDLMEELTEDNERVTKELAIVGSDTERWEAIDVMSCEELNEHTDRDHKVMSFVAFYEAIGGQHSDTESTPEPHIQHMNTTSGVESEDNVSQHLSDSEESNWSSDCERNITEEFNDISDAMDSMSGDTHRENQLTVVSTNERIGDKPIARETRVKTSDDQSSEFGDNGSTDCSYKVTAEEDSDDYHTLIGRQSEVQSQDIQRIAFEDNREEQQSTSSGSTDCTYYSTVDSDDTDDEYSDAIDGHMSDGHEGVDLYPCPLVACGQLFRTADDLQRHNDSHTHRPTSADQSSGVSPPPDERPNGSQYKCDFNGCEKVFTQLRYKERHQFRHTGEKPLKCATDGCDYRCYRPDVLKRHEESHALKRNQLMDASVSEHSFQCERRYELRQRMSGGHKGLDQYLCRHSGCGQAFLTADALKRHNDDSAAHPPTSAGHSSGVSRPPDDRPNDRRYKCHFKGCAKVFKVFRSLYRHRLLHSGVKAFKCPTNGCDYRCVRRDMLQSHQNRHKSGVRSTREALKCVVNECGYRCERWPQLRHHMNVDHKGVVYYPCPRVHCQHLFLSFDALKRHIDGDAHRVVTTAGDHHSARVEHNAGHQSADELVFRCDVIGCGKRLASKGNALRHRFTHLPDKQFKCPFDGCDYRCVQRQQLSAHTNVHLGLRPYACAVRACRKAFANKHYLKQHVLIHSDARPHPCPHKSCNMRFKTKGNLRSHRAVVHR